MKLIKIEDGANSVWLNPDNITAITDQLAEWDKEKYKSVIYLGVEAKLFFRFSLTMDELITKIKESYDI